MRNYIAAACILLGTSSLHAQQVLPSLIQSDWQKEYRASATKWNDLVHTKLAVKPDYQKCYLYGEAWITLHPHFYPTDSLRLDAKGMNIEKVAIVKNGKLTPLKYTYTDSLNLHINLDKKYLRSENYTVYIQYVSKPNEFKTQGSAAITDAKGLYFINPDGKDKAKPTQLWTQGETEGSSVWFPTIDRPDQKTTDEIVLTVPNKYVTLSNGYLASSKKNTDGTRTDDWKMTQPHAPYLFFFGVGDYAVIKDKYKNKEVNYYVEPEYASVARKIFGLTPEMIGFYSKILNLDYPWIKYSQMTARDYVSGAMENTTATLHTDALQQNARQLTDGNKYEEYVAHELFHQWFGDYVTCESWSNITVNESFANYSETLWDTYKWGKDAGDLQNYNDMQGYLFSGSEDKDLVRFYYHDKEDVFDAVSYNKGGRILHMLRHYVGDSAFFKALNFYLTQNKYGNGEAHQLRLAFEQITGQDLNWYWNQWYFGHGHPVLDISYSYDDAAKKSLVYISQKQDSSNLFQLPVDIDIYVNGKKTRHTVWAYNAKDTFVFDVAAKPDLINVDGDKVLLAAKTDHKTLAEYAYQYKYAGNFVDRREAIVYALQHPDEYGALDLIKSGLTDKFYALRELTLQNLNKPDASLIPLVEKIAKTDPYRTTKAAAIHILGNQKDGQYESFFVAGLKDSSYSIAGQSLSALAKINEQKALSYLPELQKDAKGELKNSVGSLAVLTKTDADFNTEFAEFQSLQTMDKWRQIPLFLKYLGNVNNVANFKKGVADVVDFRDKLGAQQPQVKTIINNMLTTLLNKKEDVQKSGKDVSAEIDYLKEVLK